MGFEFGVWVSGGLIEVYVLLEVKGGREFKTWIKWIKYGSINRKLVKELENGGFSLEILEYVDGCLKVGLDCF